MAKRTNSTPQSKRLMHPLAYKKIDQAINAQKDRLITTSLALVKEKTVNFNKSFYQANGPDNMLIPGMEYKLVEYLRPILEDANIPYQTYDESLKRPSLVASLGKADPSHNEVLLVVHLDTRSSEHFSWKKITDPFNGKEIGGKIYGNGISKSKGSAAALVELLLCLKQMEEKITGRIHVAFISDELINKGCNFANTLAASELDPDEVILAYQGNGPKTVGIAAPGTITLKMQASAAPDQEKTTHTLHDAVHELFITRFKPIHRSKLFTAEPTLNLDSIYGEANEISKNEASSTITLDLLPNQTQDIILDQIRTITKEISPETHWSITTEHYLPPYHIKKQPASLKVLKQFTELTLIANEETSLANLLWDQDKTPLCYGLRSQSPNDECIKVSELVTYAKNLTKLSFTLANEPKE